MTTVHRDERRQSFTEYQMAPRHIGDVSRAELLRLAIDNSHLAIDAHHPYEAGPYHQAAGSAFIEAAIVNQPVDDVDTLLNYIDLAEIHYGKLAEIEYLQLESGFRMPDDQLDWLHALVQLDFMNVYRDIACGEVTSRTRSEIITALQSRLGYATRFPSMYTKRYMKGGAAELQVMLATWQRYRRPGDAIAFPASMRADSNRFDTHDTHDVVYATQMRTSGDWSFSYTEVKSNRGKSLFKHLTRYGHSLTHVGEKGTIREFDAMPLQREPIDI